MLPDPLNLSPAMSLCYNLLKMDDRAVVYSIPIWFSLIASLAIIGYNLRRRGQLGTLPLIVLAGLTSVWSLFFGLELLISDHTARQFLEQFQIVSGSLGATVLWFVLDYTQPDRQLRQRTILRLFILPVLTFLFAQTNPIHHLLFKNSSNINLGPFSVLGYTPGVLIWVDVVVGGVFYLIALNILAAHIWRMPGVYRKQALWVVGALLFPAPLALIFLVGFSSKFLGDFVVVGFAVSAVLLNWSVSRSHLSTLMPFAHDLLYQQINQIVIILDRELRVVEINPAGQQAFSVSSNQAAGTPIEALLPGLAVLCALDSRPGSQIELNGHTYLVNCTPIQDRDGQSSGWLLMLNDFTEQHHLNAALLASQSSYRDLAEVSNDGIVIIQDEKLVFVNRRISEIFGFTEEEMLGRPFTEFLPLEDRERVKQSYLSRLGGTRSVRPLEMVLETQNSSHRDVGFNGGLTVYQGAPAVVAYVRDISSRKKIENELRRLSTAVEQNPAMIVMTDPQGRIQYTNPKFTEVTGYEREDVLGKNPRLLQSGEKTPDEYHELWETIMAGKTWRGLFHNRKKNGELFWSEALISPVVDEQGLVTQFLAIQVDVTRRITAEEALRISQARLEALRETINDLSAELELPRLLTAIVERVVSLMGVRDAELAMYDDLTKELKIVVSYLKEKDYTGTVMRLGEGCMGQVAQAHRSLIIDDYAVWEGRSRQYSPSHSSVMAVPLMSAGRLLGVLAVGDDANTRRFSNEDLLLIEMFAQQAVVAIHNAELFSEVQRLATIDPLTGILNRRSFFEKAAQEYMRARRYHDPLSVVMLDLDHFKRMNDQYGHLTGDKALSEIAATCATQTRSFDFVGRYGGEEFVIMLPETDLDGAISIAKRLCETVRGVPIETRQGPVKVTASIGVAALTADMTNLDMLIEQADAALYRAKQAGRDRVSV